MSKSILSTRKECYLCRKKAAAIGWRYDLPDTGLHRHHIVFGSADRKVSEKWGVWCWLCEEKHHVYGPEAPHHNREVAEMLMRDAQREFEKIHGHDKWMEIYRRNWL